MPGPSGVSCAHDEVCVAGAVTRCLKKEDCGGFLPFGLFGSAQLCEGSPPRYCFFDKSATIVDYCYECNPAMSCYDYKSSGACERDNCGLGYCEWHSVFDDLNSGVCVDTTKSNCENCNLPGTPNVATNNTLSLFDVCSDEKASALSTVEFPCFYDRIFSQSALSCDDVHCQMYTLGQCGSPGGGIVLDNNNNVVQSSTDPCGIGVCQSLTVGNMSFCFKNADGSSGVGVQDCSQGDINCELD